MTSLRNVYRRALDYLFSGNAATIDKNSQVPPPSPLAPIDLTDPRQVSEAMDTAARIGDLLLGSGTGNTDTRTQIHAVLASYGIMNTQVDITLNSITVFTRMGGRTNPVIVFRVVHTIGTNFSKLIDLEKLVYKITTGFVSLEEVQAQLDDIEQSPPPYDPRWSLFGWSVFAGAVSIVLGGTWLVALIATVVTFLIMTCNQWLGSHGLPAFYQNFLGGLFATVPAAITYGYAQVIGIAITPSVIIASCIVALLAGLTLVQALEDGMTGAPVTASARFFETMLQTGGIIAGIAIGISISAMLGVSLPPIETAAAPSTSVIFLKWLAGTAATGFFCLASYSRARNTYVAMGTTLISTCVYYYVLIPLGVPNVGAIGIVAVMIGFAGGILSRRYRIPPQITNWAGITPLLPGLTLYRGMYAMLNGQLVVGISNLGLALAIATALAGGVVLGEWFARRIRRPRLLRFDDVPSEKDSSSSGDSTPTTPNTPEDDRDTPNITPAEDSSLNLMENWKNVHGPENTSQWNTGTVSASMPQTSETFPAITPELIQELDDDQESSSRS